MRSPGRQGTLWAALALLLAVYTMAPAAPYTIVQALKETHDLTLLQKPAEPPRRTVRVSSRDPNGGPLDAGNHLRIEGDQRVLVDIQGPGVLRSLWTSEPVGALRFYFDGSDTPQFVALWRELGNPEADPISPPFVTREQGGCLMRFPMPFSKGLKITVSGQTWGDYVVDYDYFPPDTTVVSWWPALGPPPGAAALYMRGVEAWENPAEMDVPGELESAGSAALFSGSESLEYTAREDVLITEVALTAQSHGPIPANLVMELGRDNETTRTIPWRTITGVWGVDDDVSGLLNGRHGNRSYIRIPFLLNKGKSLAFSWSGESAGEYIVDLEVRTAQPGEGPSPELIFGERLSGNGRLLLASLAVETTDPLARLLRADPAFVIDDPQNVLAGPSLAHLFGTPESLEHGEFSAALGGLVSYTRGEHRPKRAAGYAAWQAGIHFADNVAFELIPDSPDSFVTDRTDPWLVGQRFGHAVDVPSPRKIAGSASDKEIGRHVVSEADESGLPVYTAGVDPVELAIRPFIAEGNATSGTATLNIGQDGLFGVRLALDLPLGWRGTLDDGAERREVQDIGWPWIDYNTPTSGTLNIDWSAVAPPGVPAAPHIVQLRAEVHLPDDSFHVIHRPITIYTHRNDQSVHDWKEIAIDVDRVVFEMPQATETEPGDQVQVRILSPSQDVLNGTTATLTWTPVGPVANDKGYPDSVADMLPPDGVAPGQISRISPDEAIVNFPVGRYQSWIGSPNEFTLDIPGLPEPGASQLEVSLYRRPTYPEPQGWQRRLPYLETPEYRFHMPPNKALIDKKDLADKVKVVMGMPDGGTSPHLRPAGFLENVEAGPLKWRFAEKPYRPGFLRPSRSVELRARHVGSRIAIFSEKIVGERFFGFEFGYGPECGTVAVRDCEGRLVAIQDLYLPQPCALPQWTWVALPVPSRDGWIYLEVLDTPPGSIGANIPLQKLIIVEDLKDMEIVKK